MAQAVVVVDARRVTRTPSAFVRRRDRIAAAAETVSTATEKSASVCRLAVLEFKSAASDVCR